MNASHWILGCAVAALVAAPAAFAGDLTTQDLGGVQRATSSTVTAPTSGGTSDAGLFPHSADATPSVDTDSTDDNGNLPVSTGSRRAGTHHSSVGWQSLLPGSIQ